MVSEAQRTGERWRGMAMLRWLDALRQREDRILLILSRRGGRAYRASRSWRSSC